MWIILLDHSGSMGEPFSGEEDLHSRRTRETEASVKLDAAKDVLLNEIGRLDSSFPLLIFGFTDKAQLVYQGPAGLRKDIESALDLLHAENGTDIAAALDAAADHKVATTTTTIPRIFLISDGKSDRVQAKRAARRCLFEQSMGIHLILIDPTEEGEAFVREVVEPIGCTWDTVRKHEGLEDAVSGATARYRQDQARAEAWAARAEEEAAEVEQSAGDRERVEFTAGYPGKVRSNADYPLVVFAHLASMRAQVEARLANLRASFGDVPRESQAEATSRLPIGTIIEITPAISNISVTPLRQTLAWMGELEEVSFKLRYRGQPESATPCSGFIDITASGLLIARIPVAIAIDAQSSELRLTPSTAEMIRHVFASYSRKDEAVVQACKAAYRALAIQLFVDKDDLLTGQQWRSVIRQRIADHQLFQLYWSAFAASSSEVANEWQIALEIAPQRTVDFIQPVFWSKPMATRPTQLAHLNFGFLDLSAFNVTVLEPVQVGSTTEPILGSDLERTFPIFRVVDCSPAETDRLRHDLARIVPWLEELLSVRYYPPATYLVDEHAVRSVKPLLVPQEPGNPEPRDSVALEHAIDLLQSLALAFHVGQLVGEDARSSSDRKVFFGAMDTQSEADYQHVVRMAEYVFSGPVREFIKGKDVFGDAIESLEQALRQVSNGGGSSWDVASLIRSMLAVASVSDRAVVQRIVSNSDLKELESFETKRAAAVAVKLLQTQLPELAKKYRVELFFRRPELTELRRAASFPAYIRSLCDRWLNFVDVAIDRRGNPLIEIGYSAPEDALQWLENGLPNVRVVRGARKDWQGADRTLYNLSLLDYKTSVAFLSSVLVRELQSFPERIVRFVSAIAETFGVFIPGNSLEAQHQVEATLRKSGWPAEAGISGQDKVLVCLNALQRIRDDPRDVQVVASSPDLAHSLAVSVLVHEHFHCAVANGLDRQGRASLGSGRPDAWGAALLLNESLAAWTEHHLFRNDPEMVKHIDAYISSGAYPGWPYRGAEFIESEYERGGVPTVRTWIRYLRDDPENAQAEFDRRRSETQDPWDLSASA